MSRFLSLLTTLCVAITWCSVTAGQSPGDKTPYATSVGNSTGVRRVVAGRWAMVEARVLNPSDEGAEVLAALHFDADPTTQFGRQIWVPPHAARKTWYLALVPEPFPPGMGNSVPARGVLRDRRNGRDELLRGKSEQMHKGVTLAAYNEKMMTTLLAPRKDDYLPALDADDPYEMVMAARVGNQLSRQVTRIEQALLPPLPECLDAVDQLVIYSDQLAEDEAGNLAVRTWIRNGGTAWVMLDQIQPETVEKLLGDAFECEVVDRVELSEFRMRMPQFAGAQEWDEPRTFDTPVSMVRVLLDDPEVSHEINGWPAAFWIRMGRGRVLVTTLAPRGWMRERSSTDPRPASVLNDTAYVGTLGLRLIAFELFEPQRRAVPEKVLEPFTSQQIGYQVVSRAMMLTIMGAFALAVLAGAVVLGWMRRPVWLAVWAPLAALLTTGLIAGLGFRSQNAVPSTVSLGQLVEAASGSDELTVRGWMTFYNQQMMHEGLGGSEGGTLWPQAQPSDEVVRRMVRRDLASWDWENLDFPSGVHGASFQQVLLQDEPIVATGRFGENGFQGEVRGSALSELDDALIATPGGWNLSTTVQEDGSFVVKQASVLAAGQYVPAGLVSDQQRRRQAVYGQLLGEGKRDRKQMPIHGPTLFAWSPLLESGLQLPPHTRLSGGALVTVPLRIEPAAPDTAVTVPSAFVAFRGVGGPNGEGPSSIYNNATGEWLTQQTPARAYFEFQVPRQVLPLDLDRARLRFKASCPTRTVTITSFATDAELVVLDELRSPEGQYEVVIRDPAQLRLDEQGQLRLAISVDDGGDVANDVRWQIRDLQLDVTGRTRAAEPPTSAPGETRDGQR